MLQPLVPPYTGTTRGMTDGVDAAQLLPCVLKVSNSIGMQPMHHVHTAYDAGDVHNSRFRLTSHSGLLGSLERGGPDVS